MKWDIEDLVDIVPSIIDSRERLGFEATRWDTLPIRFMCVIRELDELEVCLETNDIDGATLETADVAIYLLAIISDLFPSQPQNPKTPGV